VIYVISADVPNPASHFEALQNQANVLPPQMQSTQVGVECMYPAKDKDFAKHYLLLQDCSEGRSESSDKRSIFKLSEAVAATVWKDFACVTFLFTLTVSLYHKLIHFLSITPYRAAMALTAVAKVYGEANCSLLCINTGGGSGAAPDFFRRFQKPGLPGGGAGEQWWRQCTL
jgi:hypothetical protein